MFMHKYLLVKIYYFNTLLCLDIAGKSKISLI